MSFIKNIFKPKYKQAEEIFSEISEERLAIKRAELGSVEKYTEWLKRKLMKLIFLKEDRRVVGYPSIPNEWREKIEFIVEELQKLDAWTREMSNHPVIKSKKIIYGQNCRNRTQYSLRVFWLVGRCIFI